MEYNSLVLDIVEHNPNWREVMAEKHIKINKYHDLYTFKYDQLNCDFNDPVVREARGIILWIPEQPNAARPCVVARAFDKFMNYGQEGADSIDWASARVQQKIDGSLIKLYYWNGVWRFGTNGTSCAAEAPVPSATYSYMDLILRANDYNKIKFSELNKQYTYIFELVSPFDEHVIPATETKLWHIGTRDRFGQEYNVDIGIDKPREYDLHTLNAALDAVQHLNDNLATPEFEGFVVVDKNWHRVKIKTKEYLAGHHAKALIGELSKKKFEEMSMSEAKDIAVSKLPLKEQAAYYYYVAQLAEKRWEADFYAKKVHLLYDEYDHDRKAVANVIKKDKMALIGFRSLSGNKSGAEVFDSLPLRQQLKFVEDYKFPEWYK